MEGSMPDEENIFPLDITERAPGDRPWKFRPEGYLVAMLADEAEAHRAEAALVADGFAPHDVKVYAGAQILATYEIYKQQRDLADKVMGTVTDDLESRDLYLDHAREDRSALWLRVDEDGVARALRVLADFHYVHTRHYGTTTDTDYRMSGPSE
jgi:hypothetical protein